jgi:8-oxo-dGTP pyrophosphatase MutT (NUDIX family)
VLIEDAADYQFLMIRRKDSFGYIDLIRGKYSPNNIEQVQGIVNEMSELEKDKILHFEFRELWKMMWGDTANSQYKNEEIHSAKKFETIKNGVVHPETGIIVTLEDLVKQSTTGWKETEWEFPKGRRNNKEKDLECALREFEEETGISQNSVFIVENVLPFEETFIGTNYKSYKHKYFLAYIQEKDDLNNQPFVHFQPSEVSKMEWKTLEQCLESIRPYHLEKKQLIQNVYKVLKEYRLFILS